MRDAFGAELDDDAPAGAARTGTQAIERSVAILQQFERAGEAGLTVPDVAARTGLTTATARRMMHTLAAAGLLVRTAPPGTVAPGGSLRTPTSERFQLGIQLAILGGLALRRLGFTTALPELEALAEQTGEAVNLGVLAGQESLTVVHLPSRHALRIESYPGARNPVHVCAMGKALLAVQGVEGLDLDALPRYTDRTKASRSELLADLELVRGRGYAISDEERVVGVRAVGAPVVLDNGSAIAALAIQGPTARLTDERLLELSDLARTTADKLASGQFGTLAAVHAGSAWRSILPG